MRTHYTTIRDLAADLNEVLGLEDVEEVVIAIRAHRDLFGTFETITPDEYVALRRAVWDDVTNYAEYPF